MTVPNSAQSSGIDNPLLNRFFLSPEEKKNKEIGKGIVKEFYRLQTASADNLSYFQGRNARQIEVLLWAIGSQRMQEFLDYMNVSDANKAFVNIDTTQQRIAPQFVGTLVESMAKNRVYPCVNAIDDGSVNEKEQRFFEALFRMQDAEVIAAAQEASGVQVEPTDAFVPDDEMSARVYFELEDRLPKEIRFEEMLASVQNEIKFDRVLNRKTIFDLVTLNVAATKIERVAPGKYTVRRCVPTNLVYNFFINDTGEQEITQIGEFYNLKVKDFRKKFGKSEQNPDGLTEKQIFELAKMSTTRSVGTFTYVWNTEWAYNYFNQVRPYDDYSILVFDVEIDCGEDVYYVSKKDDYGKENLYLKNGVPGQQKKKDGTIITQPLAEGTEIIKRQKNTWMRGVYAPYGDTMLYWGRPDIIVTPFTNTAKPLSSYSINIPNNTGEYVPSLFERAIEPLREYTITKLKRKQLIAKLKPSGIRIDVESARNLDLGNGDSIDWLEVVRIYDQTGNELWSSKGVNPLEPASPPLSPTVKNRDIDDIIGLTNLLSGIVNEIRQLIGVPMYRDGSDVGDRTAAKLAEGQNQSSYNVTDYVLNGNMELWEETFYKLCLLHWNDIVKTEPESKEDMLNTRFEVAIKMKSTEYQKELLEADIQRYSQVIDKNGNPAISPKDAMMLREIDNYKLACWYLADTVERNRRKAIEDSSRAIKENAEAQNISLQQAAENERIAQAEKLKAEKEMVEFKTTREKEIKVLEVYGQISAKGLPIPPMIEALMKELYPNIAMPLQQENKEMAQAIQGQQQEEAMEQEMMAQQQPQQQMQPM